MLRSVSGVGDRAMKVTFHGVRGSTPCHGEDTARYGGNTACVSVHVDGEKPLLLDLGTGLRYFARQWTSENSTAFDGNALVTHLHWDHVQGLPFFAPMLTPGARFVVHGPRQDDGTLAEAMGRIIHPPMFPVTLDQFAGDVEFRDVTDGNFSLGGFRVSVRSVPHIGPTVGYRIEHEGRVVTYISDHQQPVDGSFAVPPSVRELAENADLLIHDAQYTRDEFARKSHWGHCTQDFAVALAASCSVKRLALFHHDPERTDAQLDGFVPCGAGDTEVFAAAEGLVISL